jgi:hypothetical protein
MTKKNIIDLIVKDIIEYNIGKNHWNGFFAMTVSKHKLL